MCAQHLESLPPTETNMPPPPNNLEPPEDVSPFPPGDAPAGFKDTVLKMLPIMDHEELIRYFSQAPGLQAATTLTDVQLADWFKRDWSVERAVTDSFNASSPFAAKADDTAYGPSDYSGLNLLSPTAWSAGHGAKSLTSASMIQPHLVGGTGATLRGSPGGSRASFARSMGGASVGPGARSLAPSVGGGRYGASENGMNASGSVFRRAPSVAETTTGLAATRVSDLRSALAGVPPQPAAADDSSSGAESESGEGNPHDDAYEDENLVPLAKANGHAVRPAQKARAADVQSIRSSIRSARAGPRRRAPGGRRVHAPEGPTSVAELLDSLHVSAAPTIPEEAEVGLGYALPDTTPKVVPPYAA